MKGWTTGWGGRACERTLHVVASFASVCIVSMAACAVPASITDPTTQWPPWLSELTLDPHAQGDDAAGGGLAYEVGHELWVDGADKHRLLLLPPADVIDDRDRARWQFPVGAVALKTLSIEGQPIETRAIRALDDGAWEYVAYRWNDDASDAQQLALDQPESIELGSGRVYQVPSRLNCRQCHESAPVPLLGVSELQLAEAGHGDDDELSRFDRLGVLLAGAPQRPLQLDAPDPATAGVLGWFVGNCVHCHHGGDGENASFDLGPAVALENIIGQPAVGSASGSGIRIVPGAPERSLLFLAVAGEADTPDVDSMPPVAASTRDEVAIATLRRWIEGLAP